MKLNVYSIFDEKANLFARPYYFAQDGEAIRAFGNGVQDPKSMMSKHASDFKLYKIGTFEEETAELTSTQPPVYLSKAVDFITTN